MDFYEPCSVPPAQAIETNLRLWLTDTGLFRAVTAPGSRLNANYVLEAKLADFGADQNTNTARAALALMLLAQRKGGAVVSVPVQRTVSAEMRLAGTGPTGIAEAMTAALGHKLRQTEAIIAATVSARR